MTLRRKCAAISVVCWLAALTWGSTRAYADDVELIEVGGRFDAVADAIATLPDVALRRSTRGRLVLDEILAASSNTSARVFVSLAHENRAVLVIVDDVRDRIQLRVLARDEGEDDVVREAFAQIAETSLRALLEGVEVGQPRVEALPQIRVIALEQPAPPAPPLRLAVELSYRPQHMGASRVSHAFFAGLVVWAARISLFASAGFALGDEVDDDATEGRLNRVLIRAGANIGRGIWQGQLAVGLDVVIPRLDLAAGLRQERTRGVDPVLGLGLRVVPSFGSHVGGFVEAGVESIFRTVRYRNGAGEVVAKHGPFRAFIAVGVRFF